MAVDLDRYLLSLVHPLAVGDEVVPGVRLAGVSTELGLRLRLESEDQRLFVDVGPIVRVRRWAARTDRLAFGYRTEGGRAGQDQGLGLRICEALAERARANEQGVLEALAEEVAAECDPEQRVRRVEATRALDPAGLGSARYYTINPYVGCVIGCRFCYAQSPIGSMRVMLGLSDYAWGSFVDVRANLPELLRRELAENEPMAVKFCPIVGDAYQPAEKTELVTRGCLEAFADADDAWAPMVLTRSTLILRDLGVFARIPGAWAGVSIPTADDEVRRHFEPRAASVSERLRILQELQEVGVRTLAVVQPMMAGDPVALAEALAPRVDAVVLDVLAEEEGAVEDFDDPRYSETRAEDWQRERALLLRDLLAERGVEIWSQELPPEYRQSSGSGR